MGGHQVGRRRSGGTLPAVVALLVFAGPAAASSTPPVITALSPESGAVGSTLTIKGSSFSGATDVHFVGGDVHASPTVLSGAKVTVTVPAGARTGPVELTTPRGGTARRPPSFVVVGGPPAITGIDPTSGVGGTTLTVTGSGLANAISVTIGGAPATVTSIDPGGTRLTAVVPSPAPSGKVVVTTPLGSATSTQTFTATSPTGIDSFSPTSGAPGTVVTITGPNLGSASEVRFSGAN